jgi:hypothetical protein
VPTVAAVAPPAVRLLPPLGACRRSRAGAIRWSSTPLSVIRAVPSSSETAPAAASAAQWYRTCGSFKSIAPRSVAGVGRKPGSPAGQPACLSTLNLSTGPPASTMPLGLVARSFSVAEPGFRFFSISGEWHGFQPPASSAHSKLEPA